MAPLEHADSIIEESVISTSPYRPEDTDNDAPTFTTHVSSLPQRSLRVSRTYGKQKSNEDNDNDTGYKYEGRAHTLRTAPPSTERMVIPESEDSSTSARHESGFKWKQQLKEIDDKFDSEFTIPSSLAISAPSESSMDDNHANLNIYANTSIFDESLSPLGLSQNSLLHCEETTDRDAQTTQDTFDDHVGGHSSPTPNMLPESAEETAFVSDIFRTGSLDANSSAGEENASHSIGEQEDVGKTSKGKRKGKSKQRSKKTSKKEFIEIRKESARLLAERPVEIKRDNQRPTRTLQHYLAKLKSPNNVKTQNSDSIKTFSSPNSFAHSEKSTPKKEMSPCPIRHSTPPKKQLNEDPDSEQSSDVELPTAESILESENAKHSAKLTESFRMKELKERKLLALRSKLAASTSSDDDLEVEELITPRKMSKLSGENAAKKQVESWPKRNNQDKQTSNKNMEHAARPLFGANRLSMTKSNRPSAMSHESLNNILLQRAETQSIELGDKKKQQWVKQGGSLKPAKASESSIESWLEKGLGQVNENDEHEMQSRNVEPETYSEDENDTRYEAMDEVAEGNENVYDEEISGEENEDEDEDEDKENQRPMPRKVRPRAIVDSDDENDMAKPVILAPDSSYADNSGSPDYHEDGDENKENIDEYDTNDENVFPPTFESSTIRPMSRMHLGENLQRASPAARSGNHSRVLQVLHEEDKENTLTSVHSSPSDPAADHSVSSTELFEGSTLVSPANFSQLLTDKEDPSAEDPSPSPLLQRGFSQLFSLSGTTTKQKLLGEESKFGGLPSKVDDGEFEFTQPNTLLPSVQISDSQRREVDNMFNKDQEFKLDEAKQAKLDAQRSGLSLSKTPYFGSFIASPKADISPVIRQPLATMSLTQIDDSEDTTMVYEESPQVKLTRLRKERPRDREVSLSPSAPDVRNAFTVLKDASINKSQKRVAKKIRSEFIEGEAQESDDEFYVGFGGMNKKQDDDEEEDEDQDAIVEGLVDDATLDDKTLAAAAVLEKHKEFEAQDEAALLKLHQDAIEGKLRVKRKNMGLGFEDSESEDEDGYRPRKNFPKKRRIEGDTLEACAQNPETRAFYEAYQQPLLEDENHQPDVPAEQPSDNDHQESVSEEEEEAGSEDIVDASTLREELRERAMQDDENEPTRPDLEDVTWVDADELQSSDDFDIQVEQGVLQGKSHSQSTSSNALRFDSNFMISNASSQEKLRLKAWASQESQTRGAGGRGGFSRKGEKDQSGSSRNSSHKQAKNDSRKEHDEASMTSRTRMPSSLIASVQKQKRFED